MKALNWYQLWANWTQENLRERWEQEKIAPDPTIGRLITWLHLLLSQQPTTQNELHRAAGLAARVERLEQRVAALETLVRLEAQNKSQE